MPITRHKPAARFVGLALALALAAGHGQSEAGDDKAGKKQAAKDGDVRKEEPPRHKERYAREYDHSFKADKELDPNFRMHGLAPQECIEFEPAGMRIHLPDGHAGKRMGTGVGIDTTVKGDFEVTLRYEMIKEPAEADAGQGTGLFLWVDLNKPGFNRGYLSRVVQPTKQYVAWYRLTPEDGQKPIDVLRYFPAKDKSGRLRLVRSGAHLYHYVSEGANEDFRLLYHHPFPVEDVMAVRWGGTTGGPQAALDGRFIDLSIRADDLPDLPRNKVAALVKRDVEPEPEAAAAPRKSFTWLIVALIIGFVIILTVTFAGGLMLYLRRKA